MAEIVKEERNERGQVTYREYDNGSWAKCQFDSSTGKITYLEFSNGDWMKWQCDSNGNCIYYEDSDGDWAKSEYDSDGNEIYRERRDVGVVFDWREQTKPKTAEHAESSKISSKPTQYIR